VRLIRFYSSFTVLIVVRQCPPLLLGPSMSGPPISYPVISMVRHCQVRQFQRPQLNICCIQYANSSLLMVTFDHQSLHFLLDVVLGLGLGLEVCGLGHEDYSLGLRG